MKNIIIAIISILAFILVLGTAGALEQNLIGCGQCLGRCAIIAVAWLGTVALTTWRD